MLYSLECQQKGHSVVTSLLSLFYRQNKQQDQQLLTVYRAATYSWWKKHDNLTISQKNRWKYNFQPSHWATDNHKGLQNQIALLVHTKPQAVLCIPFNTYQHTVCMSKTRLIHKQTLIYIHDCFAYKNLVFSEARIKKIDTAAEEAPWPCRQFIMRQS